MARLQILELPTEHHGDDMVTPFALVIDQASETTINALDPVPDGLSPHNTAMQRLAAVSVAEQIGARAVLVFEETIDIPANEVPVGPDGYPLKVRVEGDFEKFREQVQEETLYAQGKVTRAIDGQPAERDALRAATQRVMNLPERPDGPDWSQPEDYLNGYAAAIRAAQRALVEPPPEVTDG
ncbi:hypothetical protein [Streptomyces antimycoticus]